jgi:hypothetical protein
MSFRRLPSDFLLRGRVHLHLILPGAGTRIPKSACCSSFLHLSAAAAHSLGAARRTHTENGILGRAARMQHLGDPAGEMCSCNCSSSLSLSLVLTRRPRLIVPLCWQLPGAFCVTHLRPGAPPRTHARINKMHAANT